LQLFEILFLLIFALAILRLVLGPIHHRLTYATLSVAGFAAMALGAIFEGWRWQMVAAYAGFTVLALASNKKSETKLPWRMAGALPLLLMLSASAFLAHQLPVFSLPEPTGPYAVGTFDYSMTDESRKERYAPERKRELYVEVWYPADPSAAGDFPVRTLFHSLYEGRYTGHSLFFGYFEHIPTHSHVHAPVADVGDGPFPVVLFNHALDFGFTSQNQLLMEHLASHGYVVLSIAHPHQSAKVNLTNAGTIGRASEHPADIRFARQELETGIVSTVYAMSGNIAEVSAMKTVLSPLADAYAALDEDEKDAFLDRALAMEELRAYRHVFSKELLEDYFLYDYVTQNSLIQYWVEDNQFVVDTLGEVQAPVAGFTDVLDTTRLGVIGMSYGGAAAGEFCKVDSRCDAGVNLDGTQFGGHWNQPVAAPFLMFYHEQHQGGNDYAYVPPAHDFWDYTVKGSLHTDFTDFIYAWPLLKTIGFSGSIDGWRMIDITSAVQLSFFDHYLKGQPIRGELFTDFPEIIVRRHAVTVEVTEDRRFPN
jgi:predicted dienelactone hydrolase